jgi:hypothetical protein
VALDIVAALEGAGADVGTAGTAKASDHTTLLDAALLDANLRGTRSQPRWGHAMCISYS